MKGLFLDEVLGFNWVMAVSGMERRFSLFFIACFIVYYGNANAFGCAF
jgi:hypothetical protein